jgi:N-acetylglutamate synthase-like GNAT family acetyltransferase
MGKAIKLEDINIRAEIKPGDLGMIISLHGTIYHKENNHNLYFEAFVAHSIFELYSTYNPEKERFWIAEHEDKIAGIIALKGREDAAQLRYFLIVPEFRGIGLGNKLMDHFMTFAKECGYKRSYLYTTSELDKAAHLYKKFGYRLTEEQTSTRFGKELIEQRYDMEF